MIKRIIEKNLIRLAKSYPVVTITGPRQSGKTTLCKNAFPNYSYVNLENINKRKIASEDPQSFLESFNKGVILDEIQRVPELTSYIQGIVDTTNKSGQFILTGSQQFEITQSINQSLAGRTAVLKLLPCSYDEVQLFNNPPKDINEILYYGSYPRIFDNKLDPKEALAFYVSTYVERDLRSLINIKNLNSFEKFLKICAAQVGQLLNYSTLGNVCDVDQKTIKSWLSILEASYIIFQLSPHHKNFKKRLTKSKKLYFYDAGLLCYLLDINSPVQLKNHPLKGYIFESYIISELLKLRFNTVQNSNLYFFRDHTGNEVDIIADYSTEVIPIEVKSSKTINADHLKGLKFYEKLNPRLKEKSKLLYAGEESYIYKNIDIVSFKDMSKIIKL